MLHAHVRLQKGVAGLLGSVFALALTLFILPRTAFAGVAQVNGADYDSLQAAVDAIETSGTITLTSDVSLTQTGTTGRANAPVSVIIPAGKTITITDDGQARTISGAPTVGMFDVREGATLTLAGTSDAHLILQSGDFSKADGFKFIGTVVTNMGTFNLEHATIEGTHIASSQTATIHQLGAHSVFNMSGGIIQHTNAGYVTYYTGAVLLKGGTMNMSGGKISNNESHTFYYYVSGGAISLTTDSNPVFTSATFNMSGGEISNNSSDALGGGVYVGGYGVMHMTGGTIANNTADYMGGGIALTAMTEVTPDGYSATTFEPQAGSFVMDGGTISGNVSRNGGGIYDNIDNASINGGVLENNTAKFDQSPLKIQGMLPRQDEGRSGVGWGHGGAIYVSEQPRKLYLNNAIITENTAMPQGHSAMGGGLWACPTGTVDFRVTNGVAIYNNKAVTDETAGAGAAGDDVVKVSLKNAYSTINLPDRMLGAGPVTWYKDGNIIESSVGKADPLAARYDAANPGEPIHMNQSLENLAAKAVVSPEAIELAEANAKVIIRNNTASHGGGVATNGTVVMTNLDVSDWKLSVTKNWADNVSDADKQPVELFLTIGGKVLDSQVANADNNWTVTFEGLPDPDTLAINDIAILEGSRQRDDAGRSSVISPDEWTVTYSEVEKDASTQSMTATVTNTSPEPEEPTKPEEPTEPEEPQEETPQEETEEPEDNQDIPETSDPTVASALLGLMSSSALAGGMMLRRRK